MPRVGRYKSILFEIYALLSIVPIFTLKNLLPSYDALVSGRVKFLDFIFRLNLTWIVY